MRITAAELDGLDGIGQGLVRLVHDATRETRIRNFDRVVIISDDAVYSGGAATIALMSAKLLRERGIDVAILSGEPQLAPDVADYKVEFVPLGGSHILSGDRTQAALRGLFDRGVRDRVRAWIRENDTPGTIYHLHNWHKVLSPSVFDALRPVANRLFMTAHDFFLACPNGGYFDFNRGELCNLRPMSSTCILRSCDKRHYAHKMWRVARHMARSRQLDFSRTAARIVAVHDNMIPLLEKGGVSRSQIEVVRNPVRPWCCDRVIAERNNEVLFVGRLEADKGVDTLLAAATRAGVKVVVVGDGPMRAALESQYGNARFVGRLDHAAIADLATRARMIVVPTKVRETFGLVALEAITSGIPAIVSSSAMIADEIERLGLGCVCPPSDARRLASVLTELMADDAAIAAMSHQGYLRGQSLAPTPEAWCEQLIALYDATIGERDVGVGASAAVGNTC